MPNNIWIALGGGLLAFATIVLVWLLSMVAYINLRKTSHSKFGVELFFILTSLCLSFAFKLTVLYMTSGSFTLFDGAAMFFHAFYSGFGGLGFEGLESLSDVGAVWLQCCYTGSSIYAGAMFVGIITAKANYEFYGKLSLIGVQLLSRLAIRKRDIFVFTSTTPDSLELAQSITKEYKENPAKAKRKCVIIFAGDELESFDRKNADHADIMANGYIYRSYPKAKNTSKTRRPKYYSFLDRLGLKISNDYSASKAQVHLFAFSTADTGNESGLEAKNSDIVMDEIRALTAERCRGKVVKARDLLKVPFVECYILSSANDVNYAFYDRKVKLVITDVLDAHDIDYGDMTASEFVNIFKQHFQMHVVNEADLASECLSRRRIAVYSNCATDDKATDLFIRDNQPDDDNTYRAVVIGFGKTGQQAMNAVFHDTTYVNKDGVPSQFVADVYDINADMLCGAFSMTHPLIVCADCKTDVTPIEFTDFAKLSAMPSSDVKDQLIEKYADIERIYKPLMDKQTVSFCDVEKEMKFPVVGFHQMSCFELPFVKYLDRRTGTDDKPSSKKDRINSFIIALGNDEDNIFMANALIEDIKREEGRRTVDAKHAMQTIYVNVRDERNEHRINWSPADERIFGNLKVVVFGIRTDMYSYKTIIEDREEVRYHNIYEYIAGANYNSLLSLAEALKEDNGGKGYIRKMQDMLQLFDGTKMDGYDLDERMAWAYSVDGFKKESNAWALRFKSYFVARFRTLSDNEWALQGDILRRYAALESTRWNRFHIINGWCYTLYDVEYIAQGKYPWFDAEYQGYLDGLRASKRKDNNSAKKKCLKAVKERSKEHLYICPFSCIEYDMQMFDIINVILAFKEYKEI